MNVIGVCIPHHSDIKGRTTFDLLGCVVTHVIKTNDVVIPLMSEGSMLSSQRSSLVLEARKEGCTHVLFIDADMRFPQDMISRMLAHDVPIVGANCAKRRMPTSPTACNYDAVHGEKRAVHTRQDSTGLEQVDCVGTGILLIKMSVFDSTPAPWFMTPWVEAAQGYQGEDVYFMKLMKQRGVPVVIDHDLSKEIGHIGDFEYRHDHIWALEELERIPVEA